VYSKYSSLYPFVWRVLKRVLKLYSKELKIIHFSGPAEVANLKGTDGSVRK
jgi:hypothetical protein